jgi:hypothetical protein
MVQEQEVMRPELDLDAEAQATLADSAQIPNKLRPPCSRCGKPLLLSSIIPAKPGSELRVYYCASCGANDRVIAPVGAAAAPVLR